MIKSTNKPSPVSPPGAMDIWDRSSRFPDGGAANILLVDDDPRTLMAMEALLEGPGRTVVKADSGREALRCLLRQDFALILLDVRMPEMDGFETARLIRERERSRYTPIIFLSAIDTLESDVVKGVSSGAVDYLFKPVVPDILRTKVAVFVDLFHVNERLKLQAIRQSEERFRLLVESTQNYAICMLDPDGRITMWNTGAERIHGYNHLEITGQSIARFHLPEDQARGRAEEELRRAAADGRYEQEGWRVRKDGTRFWANVVITTLRDERGDLVGFSKVTRDLTDRKRAEEEIKEAHAALERRVEERTAELVQANALLQAEISERKRAEEAIRRQAELLEGTHDAIIVRDMDNNVVSWNRGAEKLYGWEREEALGKAGDVLLRTNFPKPVAEVLDEVYRAGRWEGELVQFKRDGTAIVVDSRWSLQFDGEGKPIAILEINTDVTERKRIEEKLRERERLAAMGATAAMFAHEVGNPLNGISTTVQILQRYLARQKGLSSETMVSSFEDIRREINRLSSLLHDFRFLAHPQQLALKPTSFALMAEQVLAMEAPEYAKQGIRIERELPSDLAPVMADGEKLKQALLNIFKNASEAMPEGGVLTVRGHNAGDQVVVEIGDRGAGIPEGVDIFELFTTTKPHGTGLGLAIVRQIVSAHGGTVSYTSDAGQGTTFCLALPRGSLHEQIDSPSASAGVASSEFLVFSSQLKTH
ncbi:MAG: hybrid sensor histidine kinase/response regulator [Candidatus Binatia bacterium]